MRIAIAAVGVDQRAQVVGVGDAGRGGRQFVAVLAGGRLRRVAGAARRGRVGLRIHLGELDHAPLVLNPPPTVEHVARHLDPTGCAAARRFPQPTVGLDDMIVGDLVHGAHYEAAVQIGVVGGEAQTPSLLPALARGDILAQGLVRGVVVALQEVVQA